MAEDSSKQLRPRDRKLTNQYAKLKELEKHSSKFSIRPHFRSDDIEKRFPEEYTVTFRVRGLTRMPMSLGTGIPSSAVGEEFIARIILPAMYPEVPPIVYLISPIFHPNIKTYANTEAERQRRLEEYAEMVKHQQGEEVTADQLKEYFEALADGEAQFERIYGAGVCLHMTTLPSGGGSYVPRVSLYDICVEVANLLMYKNYRLYKPDGTPDVFNVDALKWIEVHKMQGNLPFPVDTSEFLDRLPPELKAERESLMNAEPIIVHVANDDQ